MFARRETKVPVRLIDGPVDPNSGAHMARRYAEAIPNADVVMLADDIGHWPQLEAPEARAKLAGSLTCGYHRRHAPRCR
jgi:pimeloyl-ACP methyl ester carboxylesterase